MIPDNLPNQGKLTKLFLSLTVRYLRYIYVSWVLYIFKKVDKLGYNSSFAHWGKNKFLLKFFIHRWSTMKSWLWSFESMTSYWWMNEWINDILLMNEWMNDWHLTDEWMNQWHLTDEWMRIKMLVYLKQ